MDRRLSTIKNFLIFRNTINLLPLQLQVTTFKCNFTDSKRILQF